MRAVRIVSRARQMCVSQVRARVSALMLLPAVRVKRDRTGTPLQADLSTRS